MLGHRPENFHPTSFSQCSGSMPQFSNFQSETPIFRLWECSECPCPCSTCSCLLPFWRPVVVCSISPEHTYIDPLRRRPHPYALWSQQVTSPVHCGPGWALSSHSPIPTPQCGGNAEKVRWFGGDKRGILHAPYKHSKLTCHPHLSNTTPMCHMAKVVCLLKPGFSSVQCSPVTQSCQTLCDPMNRSTPGLPLHHQLPEFTQTHIHQLNDAIQPSHPLSSPSPPAPNPSQHQSLFQWVNSSQEVAKVLEFQL